MIVWQTHLFFLFLNVKQLLSDIECAFEFVCFCVMRKLCWNILILRSSTQILRFYSLNWKCLSSYRHTIRNRILRIQKVYCCLTHTLERFSTLIYTLSLKQTVDLARLQNNRLRTTELVKRWPPYTFTRWNRLLLNFHQLYISLLMDQS